jgi:protein SCO1/2
VTIGGPFELIAADGSVVTDETFRGRWMLVFFGYTFCPDLCPTTLAAVAGALEALGDDAARVRPVFITVDPERDAPSVIGAYVAAFDDRIVGLTGSAAQIASAAKTYGAYFEARRADAADAYYAVDHSTYLYVVDPEGAFVRAIAHDETSENIAAILREMFRRE